jgi:hypothetical protein
MAATAVIRNPNDGQRPVIQMYTIIRTLQILLAAVMFHTCSWETLGFKLLGLFDDFPQCLEANTNTASTKGFYHFLHNLCVLTIHNIHPTDALQNACHRNRILTYPKNNPIARANLQTATYTNHETILLFSTSISSTGAFISQIFMKDYHYKIL